MPFETLFAHLGPPGKHGGRARQQRLYELLRQAILKGLLSEGHRLPASRQLAQDYRVSRNTVIHAYETLRAEGFVVADRQGTRVARLTLAGSRPSEGTRADQHPMALSQRARPMGRLSSGSEHLPFAPGIPDLNLFPWRKWFRHLEHAWKSVGARHLAYAPAGGERRLREAIATQLALTRGIACSADQVLVTSGAQMAIDVCGRLLADPGDVAWLETPGYPSARATLQASGLKLINVPVDPHGMSAGPELWQRQPPRLVLVTPSHQYPMGSVMPLERRLELLEQAGRHRSWIIEDDYDSDLQHHGTVIPAIQSLTEQAAVVYVGTFSKALYPGLRVGYLVVPSWISERFSACAHQLFPPSQAMEQIALARFMESGDLARHLRHMRSIYRERQRAMRAHLEGAFGDAIQILGGQAGVHLTLVFAPQVNDRAIADRAYELGVTARPLSDYGAPSQTTAHLPGLVLGYGAADEQQIASLIPRLKQAYDEVTGRLAP